MVAEPHEIDEDGSELEMDELGAKHFEHGFLSLLRSKCGILEKCFDFLFGGVLSTCIE